MVLGLEANQWVAVVVGIACLAALLIIVLAPWQRVRSERPLSPEAQTRLLLGDNPDEIAQERQGFVRAFYLSIYSLVFPGL
jgi:hypothetical protein